MTQEAFADKRLLGALDYIDERFIAEVTESYTFEAPGEYKRDKKSLFRTYRRLAVLAACLVLISAVFPVVHYVLPRLAVSFGGNAGAGADYDPQNSAVFDYPVDMSAEEIYADLLDGGWLVYSVSSFNSSNKKIIAGEELWDEFYQKVRDGESAVFRSAFYVEKNDSSTFLPDGVDEPDGMPCIELIEVFYDSNKYHYSRRVILPSYAYDTYETSEYKYLKLSKQMYKNESRYFFLVNDPNIEYWSPFSSFSAPDMKKIYYID